MTICPLIAVPWGRPGVPVPPAWGPAWIANVEYAMHTAEQDADYVFALQLLDWLCGPVNRWLDETRVHGNPAARRLWARICRCYLRIACFVCLRGCENGGLTRIVDTCVRLNGLRLTPWTPKAGAGVVVVKKATEKAQA